MIELAISNAITAIIAFFLGHFSGIKRDKRKEFNSAGDELRKVFNQAIVDIRNGNWFSESDTFKRANERYVSYLNFRHYLGGECRNRYDEAWEDYCLHSEDRYLLSLNSKKIIEDIEYLLEFTESKKLRTIVFLWQKYTFRFFFKYFPQALDKKTKQRIEKIFNHKNIP